MGTQPGQEERVQFDDFADREIGQAFGHDAALLKLYFMIRPCRPSRSAFQLERVTLRTLTLRQDRTDLGAVGIGQLHRGDLQIWQ